MFPCFPPYLTLNITVVKNSLIYLPFRIFCAQKHDIPFWTPQDPKIMKWCWLKNLIGSLLRNFAVKVGNITQILSIFSYLINYFLFDHKMYFRVRWRCFVKEILHRNSRFGHKMHVQTSTRKYCSFSLLSCSWQERGKWRILLIDSAKIVNYSKRTRSIFFCFFFLISYMSLDAKNVCRVLEHKSGE